MRQICLPVLFALCKFLPVLPVHAQAAVTKGSLFRVLYSGGIYQPYRQRKGGDYVGNIVSNTIVEVLAVEGDWARIRYRGKEFYMWAKKLMRVDAPDVVCSPWALEWLSAYDGTYYGISGEWPNAREDWTRTISREDMAVLFVNNIMSEIYGSWVVRWALPIAFIGADELEFEDILPNTDHPHVHEIYKLLQWGIVPPGKLDPKADVTYGEFTDMLIKLMAYDKMTVREGGGFDFTRADIEKFGIGGDTNRDVKTTMEQARILCEKTVCWWKEMELLKGADCEQTVKATIGTKYSGSVWIYNGVYTIKTFEGTQYLVIDGEGMGELSDVNEQRFIVTYKKCIPDKFRSCIYLYTLQTLDGKYLALSSTPMNGSHLITQDEEYLWCIKSGGSKGVSIIYSPMNRSQLLNASGWGTEDGAYVSTWYVANSVPDNALWQLEYVGH